MKREHTKKRKRLYEREEKPLRQGHSGIGKEKNIKGREIRIGNFSSFIILQYSNII